MQKQDSLSLLLAHSRARILPPPFSLPPPLLTPASKIACEQPPPPLSSEQGAAVHLQKQDPSGSHARFEQALLLRES